MEINYALKEEVPKGINGIMDVKLKCWQKKELNLNLNLDHPLDHATTLAVM